jgi:hypothetical protein
MAGDTGGKKIQGRNLPAHDREGWKMKKYILAAAFVFTCALQVFAAPELKVYSAVVHDKEHSPGLRGDGKIQLGCNLSWFIDWAMTCSDFLHSSPGNDYDPNKLKDQGWLTAWVENGKGYGEGEWVEMYFRDKDNQKTDPTLSLGAISFYNGYIKNEKTWLNNARVKKLGVLYNGKKVFTIKLEDTMDHQTVQFPPLKIKPGVKLCFAIEDVYPGYKYEDTAITEIILEGGNCLGETGE